MTERGLSRELVGALHEIARVKRLLVALDFDGTLAPEVDDPEQARATPEARAAVLALLAIPNTRVALISGRSIASLEQVSDLPDEALLVGSHGIEIRLDHPGDTVSLDTSEIEQVSVLGGVLGEVADSFDQVWLETKPAGFALHTRLASDHNSRVAHLVALSEATAEVDNLTVRRGKDVLEFSVRGETKGDAVEHLRAYTSATRCSTPAMMSPTRTPSLRSVPMTSASRAVPVKPLRPTGLPGHTRSRRSWHCSPSFVTELRTNSSGQLSRIVRATSRMSPTTFRTARRSARSRRM